MTNYSIVAKGFRIGGEAGHRKAVGDKKVYPVLSRTS